MALIGIYDMSVWLVILLVALLLSPLSWLMPSRGQRGQMDVRLQARRLGLAMQISHQTWPHWLERQPPTSVAQYHRARSTDNRDAWCYWQTTPGVWLDRWQEASAQGQLAEGLAALPEDVYSVEANPQFLALYWGERGGNQALQQVAEFLQRYA